jgi:nucleotide-binding universal stress UspA family protein
MIKDVMVHLDGTEADNIRIAAAVDLAEHFDSHVIGLLLNVMPEIVPAADGLAGADIVLLMDAARRAGDAAEAALTQWLAQLNTPAELRRIDVIGHSQAAIAAAEARAADTFVALRPNGDRDPEQMIEEVLFGSGRHVYLVPETAPTGHVFNHVLLAWNGSRESARALAEAMPYLVRAEKVTVIAVVDDPPVAEQATLGDNAVRHLLHHGVGATLHHAKREKGGVAQTLISEANRLKADLLVMGGYGSSRLREWLLGGTTYKVLHGSPVPLVMSH